MSTVAPSESASNGGKKKNRPGKNARKAAKDASGVNSSVSRSDFFASQIDEPLPQPGKYPVVFRTGVGEPTRDVDMAYDESKILSIVDPLVERYIYNPKYAEFSDHSGYTDEIFTQDITRLFLLGLAQQTVHAHVNLGLPLGDFSSIASTELSLFTSLANVVRQFGEYQDPSLGSRFLLKDYATTVKSLVRAASQATQDRDRNVQVINRIWLPTKAKDARTTFLVASALGKFIGENLSIWLDQKTLEEHLFDSSWDAFDALKPLFGAEDVRSRFDFLFSSYSNEQQFVTMFSSASAQGVLRELGLTWQAPSVMHLHWELVPKIEFPSLVEIWARKKSAISTFLSCTSGSANRNAASGSHSQASVVKSLAGVTVVNTHVALSAPDLSLLACFPPSAILAPFGQYNVVVSTSIALNVRATEYLQLDWKV